MIHCDVNESRQNLPGIEVFHCNVPCGLRVLGVIRIHVLDRRNRLITIGKRQNPLTGRDDMAEPRVLDNRRSPRGEVACRSATKPSRLAFDITVFRDAPLRFGVLNVIAIRIQIGADHIRITQLPAMTDKRLPGRPSCLARIDGNLHRLRADTRGQFHKPVKLHVLLPVGLAFIDQGGDDVRRARCQPGGAALTIH